MSNSRSENEWEEVIALFLAGHQEEAFELFDEELLSSYLNKVGKIGDMSNATIAFLYTTYNLEPIPEEADRQCIRQFLEFAIRRYLNCHDKPYKLWSLIYEDNPCRKDKTSLWVTLPQDLQKQIIKKIVTVQYPVPFDNEEFNLKMAEEIHGIMLAWCAYGYLKRKDSEIEETIISYARERERYDCVLISYEKFGRIEEALQLLKEAPSHLLFPLSKLPEEEAKRFKQKLDFKLKQMKQPQKVEPCIPTKEELEQMFALGEITKAEYEKMKNDFK